MQTVEKMSALRPPHRKEVLQAREDDIKEKVENWMSKESESRFETYFYRVVK